MNLPLLLIALLAPLAYDFLLPRPRSSWGLTGAAAAPLEAVALVEGGPLAAVALAVGMIAATFLPVWVVWLGLQGRSLPVLRLAQADRRFEAVDRAPQHVFLQALALVAGVLVAWAVDAHLSAGPQSTASTVAAALVVLIALRLPPLLLFALQVRGLALRDLGSEVAAWMLLAPATAAAYVLAGWGGALVLGAIAAQLQVVAYRAYAQAVRASAAEAEAQMALTDGLTGLPNRRGIISLWADHPPTHLAVIDIDHFKLVNDRFGHVFGDDVLRACAAHVRATGLWCGRYGGEEFVVALHEWGSDDAASMLEDLRVGCAEDATVRLENGEPIRYTISIGFTAVAEHEAFGAAFKRADAELYQAKESGRNRVMPLVADRRVLATSRDA